MGCCSMEKKGVVKKHLHKNFLLGFYAKIVMSIIKLVVYVEVVSG